MLVGALLQDMSMGCNLLVHERAIPLAVQGNSGCKQVNFHQIHDVHRHCPQGTRKSWQANKGGP